MLFRTMTRRASRSLATLLGLFLSAGCLRAVGPQVDGGTSATDAGPQLATIAIDPPLASVAIGTSIALQATGTYDDGTTVDVTNQVVWASQPDGVVTVAAGVVTAVKPGEATVQATLGTVSGAAQVTVPNATVRSLELTPTAATTGVGGTVSFSAVASLSDGTQQDVTKTATWTSSNPAIASISSSGLATGRSGGTVDILATAAGVTGHASLSVTSASLKAIDITPPDPVAAVGVVLPFAATATYADGSIADVTLTATWSSSNPSSVTIDAAGHATAAAPGTTTIAASLSGIKGSTRMTVTQATLTSIAVSPPSLTLPVKGTGGLKATGTYSDGTTADLTSTVGWSSGVPAVAFVSSGGRVTGVSAGTATVSASQGSVQGSASVTVTAATLTSLAISPTRASVPVGATVSFRAEGSYSDGSSLDVTSLVAWSTDDRAIATVNTAGVVTGVAVGATTLRALLNGVVGSAPVTVTNASLVSLAVSPSSSTLQLGATEPMKATGTYADGTSVDLTNIVVWTSSDTTVAAVSNAQGSHGLATATGPGSATVTATLTGITGTASLSVTAPPPQQISISPAAPTRPVGSQVAFTASAQYPNGATQDVTAKAAWSSSSVAVASVDASGNAQTLSQGTTQITATFMGVTGSTTLTVTGAQLDHISVTPSSPTLAVGVYAALDATATFTDGTVTDVTAEATWSSSNPSIATVTSQGIVNAVAAGTAQIQATWHAVTGSTQVTVSAAALVAIHVDPAVLSLPVGVTDYYSAQAVYADKSSQDITMLASWSSTAPGVADVQLSSFYGGIVTTVSAGTATIRVAYGGLVGTATVTVTNATLSTIQITPPQPSVPIGTAFPAVATAIFSDETTEDVTYEASWTSSSPSVADVGNSDFTPPYKGFVTATSAGTTALTAAWHGVSGTTVVTVTPATLKTIQITPFSPKLPVGFGTYLQATGIYSDNTTEDLTFDVSFTSDTPSVASVGTLWFPGRLSTFAPGTATISAAYEGVIGTTVVTVTSATLSSIAVSPGTASISVGAVQRFTAQGTFSDGSTLDVTADVTWFSSSTSVAQVSNAADWGTAGQATGLAAGTTTVSAVQGKVTGTAQLTVH